MRQLAKHQRLTFYQVESPVDIENAKIKDFEFFKQMGIINYKETFKAWLRKFPKPIFIIAMEEDVVLGWIHIDEWGEGAARDGNPIYILRAIETIPKLRRRKLGYRLVLLGLKLSVGYMVVKPINQRAESFFKEIGFRERTEFKHSPMDLSKHPTYRILPLGQKHKLVKKLESYFEVII